MPAPARSRSNIPLQFSAEGRPCDRVELMLPKGAMIDLLIDRAQMRKLVHQGFEAVASGAPAYKNRLAILQCHSAYATTKYLLDYGFADYIDLPAVRHWLRPDAGPSLTRQLGYILPPDRSFETSHL
jgi:hypothetical protein